MRRFNLPGFHYVNVSAALHLDTDVEPTITVVSASTEVAADDKKVRFVESSNVTEETDSTKQYNLLHISGVKGMLFKGGNTIDFGGGDLALHINTDEEPVAGYDNEVITISNRNSMEEVDSTNHINILHMNSIKDLFFRIKNNSVFSEFKTLFTRGALYDISGRTSQGVDLGLNGEGASVDGQVLTLIQHDDVDHAAVPTVTMSSSYNSTIGKYQATVPSGSEYDLPVAMSVPSGTTITNAEIVYSGLDDGTGPGIINVDWLQQGDTVVIYGYD